MKVVAHMNVLNGMTFLPCAVMSVLPFVEKLMIVEMSEPFSSFMANDKGLSKDGTTEYLQELAEEHPDKVAYYPKGQVSRIREAREFLIQETPDDTDFMLRVDSDEIFHPVELRFSLAVLQKGYIGMAPFYHFWRDLRHVLTSRKPSHWNNLKPRFVPFSKDVTYPHADFTSLYHTAPKLILPMTVYHCSWAKPEEEVFHRIIWHNFKWEGFTNLKAAEAFASQHFFFHTDITNPAWHIFKMDQEIEMEVKLFDKKLPPALERWEEHGCRG